VELNTDRRDATGPKTVMRRMIIERFNDGASLRGRWQVCDGSEKVTDCCSMPTSLLTGASEK
jgi:hypothetical protein